MAPKLNGKGTATIASAIGGLAGPPTVRVDLGTVWVDMIVPSQSNQLFRSRLVQMRDQGTDLNNLMRFDPNEVMDSDGRISEKVIHLIHTCFISDWGGFDKDGEHCPLYDEEGKLYPCTLENFSDVVRDQPGGDVLFFAIQTEVVKRNAERTQMQVEEKNSSKTSRGRPTTATRSSTRKGPKPARA